MSDLDIIREIEKEIGRELEKLESYDAFTESKVGFVEDNNGNITHLALDVLELKTIPSQVLKLFNLTNLGAKYSQLSQLPEGIGELKRLQELSLYNGQLTRLPEGIGELKNLKTLFLFSNQLTELPESMGGLEKLEELDLRNNKLAGLPEVIGGLENLKRLDLRYNRLTELPEWLLHTGLCIKWDFDSQFKGIYLAGNSLESPPIEIVVKGHDAVIEWFKSLEIGEKRALNEVKVLLVGDGEAGKTCLVKRLLDQGFNPHELQTNGINIDKKTIEVDGKKITAHLWDFGGQEIMHATHQFFLSRRSLYVVVLDGRRDDRPEYWLKHVESFGSDSPILVVINKIDENAGYDVNRNFLLSKYKGIKGFYRTSCKNGSGIDEFAGELKKALTEVEILQTSWPESWFKVKSKLEDLEKNFITLDDYKKICRDSGIEKEIRMNTLVDFLNDLGIVVHFPDFELLDTHVLDPEWITGAVYRIINSEKLANCNGKLELKLLDEILKKKHKDDYDYPSTQYSFIINIMKKFEICYSLDKERVLIPDLLEIQEPVIDYNYDDCLRFVIEYEFLPHSVMPRFIVRRHREIKSNFQWRTGVVLEDDNLKSSAVIKADYDKDKILIYVNGEHRREYFSVVLHTLRGINSSFEKMNAVEKVPLPDEPEVMVSYNHLLKLEQRGIETYLPDGSDKEYKVKELLGTVFIEHITEKDLFNIMKRFIDKLDTEETIAEKVNEFVELKPGLFGVNFDVKKIIKKLINWKVDPELIRKDIFRSY